MCMSVIQYTQRKKRKDEFEKVKGKCKYKKKKENIIGKIMAQQCKYGNDSTLSHFMHFNPFYI